MQLHLNYYEQPGKRQLVLIFENSKVFADLNKKKKIFYNNNKKIIKKFHYQRNDLFLSEIKYFFNHLKNKKQIDDSLNLNNGIKTLELAIRLKKIK